MPQMPTNESIERNNNNNHDDWKIALYYCYVPIGNQQHHVAEHISFQQSICQQRQLMGRIRVSSEGVNGVLSGLLSALQEYEHLLRQELQSILSKAQENEQNDDQTDHNNNHNDDPTTLELDVKYCHLHTHLPVSSQLFDSLSVKATREVVSLFEPLEPDVASHDVPTHPDQRNYWRRRRRRRQQQQQGKKQQQEDGNEISDTLKEEDSDDVTTSTSHVIISPSMLDNFQPAPHLSPRQWHNQLQQASLLSSMETSNQSSCHDTVTDHAPNNSNDQANNANSTTTTTSTRNAVVVLDARNVYESRVGYFAAPHIPTILANTRKYSDLPKVMQEVADQLSGKDVYMYCTGGVRCERASMYLQALISQQQQILWNEERPPPRRIFQLQGGIQRYLEEFGHLERQTPSVPVSSNEQKQQRQEKEEPLHSNTSTTDHGVFTESTAAATTTTTSSLLLFRGKNFVFDPRRTDPLVVSNEIIVGRCLLCDTAHDDYDNGAAPCEDHEARCQKCRVLLLVCPTCRRSVQWKHPPTTTTIDDDDDTIPLPPLLCGKNVCVDEGNSVSQIATILIQE